MFVDLPVKNPSSVRSGMITVAFHVAPDGACRVNTQVL